jgi:hypothetical protein
MANRNSEFPQSQYLSIPEAIEACKKACDLTDVQRAYAFIQTLLAREKRPDEDDVLRYDGMTSLMRLIADSMRIREEAAVDALETMLEVVEREGAR